MKTIVLQNAAAQDLVAIWNDRVDRCGVDRADDYIMALTGVFERIAKGYATAKPADDVKTGLRRAVYRDHVVFVREEETRVVIVRALHEFMDPGRWSN